MNQIKHIAAALVLALIAPAMSAQIYQSKSYVKKTTITKEEKAPDTNPWKKCQWYGRMGVLIPVSVDKSHDAHVNPSAGFDLDFGFKLRMGRHGWYWGMDLAMITGGFSVKSATYYDTRTHNTVTRKGGSTSTIGGRLGLTSFGWRAKFSDFTTDINAGIAISVCSEAKMHNKGYFDEVYMEPAAIHFPIGIGVAYKKLTLDFTMFVTPPLQRISFDYSSQSGSSYYSGSVRYSDFRIAVGYLF